MVFSLANNAMFDEEPTIIYTFNQSFFFVFWMEDNYQTSLLNSHSVENKEFFCHSEFIRQKFSRQNSRLKFTLIKFKTH